jgi:hypothetical protein
MQNDCSEFAQLALAKVGPKCTGGAPNWAITDAEGRTPLMLAALYNNTFLVRHIIDEAKVRDLSAASV